MAKMQVVQGLRYRDEASCFQFCKDFQGFMLQNPIIIHQLLKSDELNFHFFGAMKTKLIAAALKRIYN
jgi:hypothetical protein